MSRLLTQLTVPGSGRGGGPIYVKFLPAGVDGGMDSSAIVATADGRLFRAEPENNRILTQLANIDGTAAAMTKAALRGQPFVPTPESTRVRISAVSLSPSGAAAALVDSDGLVHVLTGVPGAPTSLMGFATTPAMQAAGPEPWLSDSAAEVLWSNPPVDATALPDGGPGGMSHGHGQGGPGMQAQDPSTTASKMVNSFAAAIAARANAARAAGQGPGGMRGGMGPGPFGPGVGPMPMPIGPAFGNATNTDEAATDSKYDAVLLAGIGSDVPVAAPGISSLVPTLPYTPWDALWSTGLDVVQDQLQADLWGDNREAGGAGAGGEKKSGTTPSRYRGSPSKSGRGYNTPLPFYAPGKERASTFPDGYLETVLVSVMRKALREIDPALLATMADRSGSYVNNRVPSLRLRPNALIYGTRKGYVNVDPRQRAPGKSSLGLGPDGRPKPPRDRKGSLDTASVSTGGSTADLERMMRGEGLDEDESEVEVEDGEDGDEDAASVDSVVSLAKASGGAVASAAASSSTVLTPYVPLLKKGRPRVPRAYRRPRLTATRYGFFDTDYSRYRKGLAALSDGASATDLSSGINGSGVYGTVPGIAYAYAGLEDVGPNTFINAPVQLLFFARALRRRVQSHLCAHPHCTACELRFLFDGMVQTPSLSPDARVLPAHNVVRVLVHGEARKLGLLHPCTLEPGRRLELYLRMALDRLGKELAGGHGESEMPPPPGWTNYTQAGEGEDSRAGGRGKGGPQGRKGGAPKAQGKGSDVSSGSSTGPGGLPSVDRGLAPEPLFGVKLVTTTACLTAGHASTRDMEVMLLDMNYTGGASASGPGGSVPGPAGLAVPAPGAPPSLAAPTAVVGHEYSFASILRSSLVSTKRQKAWCEGCKAYVPTNLTKAASGISPLLCLATSLSSSEPWARDVWRTSRADGRPWVAPYVDIGVASGAAGSPNASSGGASGGPQVYVKDPSDPSGAPASGSPATAPAGTARYALVGMLLHVPPASALKPTPGPGGAQGKAGSDLASSSSAAVIAPGSVSESAAGVHFHYAAVLKVTPHEGSYAPGPGDASGPGSSAADRSAWLIFNDFRVTPTTQAEALDMRPAWKKPVVLLYQRIDHEAGPSPAHVRFNAHVQALMSGLASATGTTGVSSSSTSAAAAGPKLSESQAVATAISARAAAGYLFPDCFGGAAGATAGTPAPSVPMPMACDAIRVPPHVYGMPPSIPHQPLLGPAPALPSLPADAVPRTGELLALDAEFVAVSTERARVRADGTRQLLAPARLMPGRLSVVRDTSGRAGGPPLTNAAAAHRVVLDTYVVASEHVVDHLTRFSGIQAGDLDIETSPHRLHTYKSVYLRLRALIDNGCRVVGHGLRKDFRELGAILPPALAVDTVQLWRGREPGARYLSLRFLASHVLGTDIQGTVHDSNEDAECALALYRAYTELEAEGGRPAVDRLLQALYDIGRATGWKARTPGAPSVPPNLLPASLRPKPKPVQVEPLNTSVGSVGPGMVGGPQARYPGGSASPAKGAGMTPRMSPTHGPQGSAGGPLPPSMAHMHGHGQGGPMPGPGPVPQRGYGPGPGQQMGGYGGMPPQAVPMAPGPGLGPGISAQDVRSMQGHGIGRPGPADYMQGPPGAGPGAGMRGPGVYPGPSGPHPGQPYSAPGGLQQGGSVPTSAPPSSQAPPTSGLPEWRRAVPNTAPTSGGAVPGGQTGGDGLSRTDIYGRPLAMGPGEAHHAPTAAPPAAAPAPAPYVPSSLTGGRPAPSTGPAAGAAQGPAAVADTAGFDRISLSLAARGGRAAGATVAQAQPPAPAQASGQGQKAAQPAGPAAGGGAGSGYGGYVPVSLRKGSSPGGPTGAPGPSGALGGPVAARPYVPASFAVSHAHGGPGAPGGPPPFGAGAGSGAGMAPAARVSGIAPLGPSVHPTPGLPRPGGPDGMHGPGMYGQGGPQGYGPGPGAFGPGVGRGGHGGHGGWQGPGQGPMGPDGRHGPGGYHHGGPGAQGGQGMRGSRDRY